MVYRTLYLNHRSYGVTKENGYDSPQTPSVDLTYSEQELLCKFFLTFLALINRPMHDEVAFASFFHTCSSALADFKRLWIQSLAIA